jgi:PhoPQ-activated pathogenicity-related protein
LEEVDIGYGSTPWSTSVNKNMKFDPRNKIIELLLEYFDYFAWSYTNMPGLSQELVEHRLPIEPGFKPFKQKRLLEANLIRPCRYAKWVSNIMPVEKKDSGKMRVCIDFRNLNRVTPKDEYHMLVDNIFD